MNEEVKKEDQKEVPKSVKPKTKAKEEITQKVSTLKVKITKVGKPMSAVAAASIVKMHERYKFYVARNKAWKGQNKIYAEWKELFLEKGLL